MEQALTETELSNIRKIVLKSGLTLTVEKTDILEFNADIDCMIIKDKKDSPLALIKKVIKCQNICYYDFENHELNHLKSDRKLSLINFSRFEQEIIIKAEQGDEKAQEKLTNIADRLNINWKGVEFTWEELAIEIATTDKHDGDETNVETGIKDLINKQEIILLKLTEITNRADTGDPISEDILLDYCETIFDLSSDELNNCNSWSELLELLVKKEIELPPIDYLTKENCKEHSKGKLRQDYFELSKTTTVTFCPYSGEWFPLTRKAGEKGTTLAEHIYANYYPSVIPKKKIVKKEVLKKKAVKNAKDRK